jgi:hypothetical protein
MRHRRLVVLALIVGALTLLVVQGGAAAHKQPAHATKQHVKKDDNGSDGHALKHIFVIMLENHSQSSVIDDVNAPYITQLAHSNAMAADYFGVTHPSEPNYVAAISGSNWFVQNDNPANRFDHTNLVDQLEANGLTWRCVHGVDAVGRIPGRLLPELVDPAVRVEAQSVCALQRHPLEPGASRER